MKSMKTFATAAAITMLCVTSPLQAAVTHGNKQLEMVEPMWVGNDCLLFRLVGVVEADPVKPGVGWFAVSRSDPGYKEAFAGIMMAKAMGTAVTIGTTGQLACGYAQVAFVVLP